MLSTIIIGGGPGGLGPLIWSAQAGLLPNWLARGVVVVDRQRVLGGTLGRYAINSDSLGGAYLEFLDAPGTPDELRALRDDPLTREMEEFYDSFPPLDLVYRFLRRLGTAMEGIIAAHPGCAFWGGTDVRSLHLRSENSLEALTVGADGTATVLEARTAIVALGGRQSWIAETLIDGLKLENCQLRYLMPSDRLLSHSGLREAERVLRADPNRPIVVLGGSHSAYSVAWTLANLLPSEALGQRQVYILQRRPPRIFYPTRQAAEDDEYTVVEGDICPRTQRVNRLGGLRGDGRDMWRRIVGRPDVPHAACFEVLTLHEHSTAEVQRLLEEAALVIPAFGYRSATLPIYDAHGRRLELSADSGGDNVDQGCRVLLTNGSSVPNVFGIGLGTGFRPFGTMGGEPNFSGQANSLWLYQNGIGAVVQRGIFEQLDGVESDSGSRAAARNAALWSIAASPQGAE